MDSGAESYEVRRAAPGEPAEDGTTPDATFGGRPDPLRPGAPGTPRFPPDDATSEPDAFGRTAGGATTPDRVEWRVRPAITVLKGVGALLFVGAGLWAGRTDRVGLVVGLAVAVVLAALAVRDLVAPVSLAADRDGVTVRGVLGRHRVPWSEVERVRVDHRSRRGIRSELVEIDCDTQLHLFGRNQLGGADCAEVVRRLDALRPTGSTPR